MHASRRFPVLLTMCHMGVCSIMAYAVSKMGITPKHQLKSTAQLYKVCSSATATMSMTGRWRWLCFRCSPVCNPNCRTAWDQQMHRVVRLPACCWTPRTPILQQAALCHSI